MTWKGSGLFVVMRCLLPVVLFSTAKHWRAGTHFPLTSSSSVQVRFERFPRRWRQVLRQKELQTIELKGHEILPWLCNCLFFCR